MSKVISEAKLQIATAVIFVVALPIAGVFFSDLHSQIKETSAAIQEGKLRDAELMTNLKLMRVEFEMRISDLEQHERGEH